jgi:hypothetical protein
VRWLSALAFAVALCVSGAAPARSMEGTGRISALPGWRYTPNDHFYAQALRLGFEAEGGWAGGPQLTMAFTYAATEGIEACIDLFGGLDRLGLVGRDDIQVLSYGGLIGARFFWVGEPLFLPEGLIPSVGLFVGPTLVYVTAPDLPSTERLVTGYAVSAGLTARLSEWVGITAEVKLLGARGTVPGISGVNAGGLWAGLGVTWYFPGEPGGQAPLR